MLAFEWSGIIVRNNHVLCFSRKCRRMEVGVSGGGVGGNFVVGNVGKLKKWKDLR